MRRAHARGARLIGFCSGAFTLAEAGLLDGRRAACHWMWADSFRARFPAVRLERDMLFVDDGDILTASGSASALDLGLHVVRRDHGAEIANAVSRRLVFAAHRDGGQRQFVERPVPDVPDESLGPLLAWAQERLDEPLTVADLAARAAVSPPRSTAVSVPSWEPHHWPGSPGNASPSPAGSSSGERNGSTSWLSGVAWVRRPIYGHGYDGRLG